MINLNILSVLSFIIDKSAVFAIAIKYVGYENIGQTELFEQNREISR